MVHFWGEINCDLKPRSLRKKHPRGTGRRVRRSQKLSPTMQKTQTLSMGLGRLNVSIYYQSHGVFGVSFLKALKSKANQSKI